MGPGSVPVTPNPTPPTTTPRQQNGLTRVGCPKGDGPYQGRGKTLASLLLTARACARPWLGPAVGLCSSSQAIILREGVEGAWAVAEERTLLTQGS